MSSRLVAALTLVALTAAPAFASEGEAQAPVNLLAPNGGLMFWTLLIFLVVFAVLAKFAFKPLMAAVEARELALESSLAQAKADRDAAAKLMADAQAALDASRREAQQLVADGRAAGEKLKGDLLEAGKTQQAELLERARRELNAEKERAIVELRREAVELAIKGAGKVIEKNLDDATNRQLVEGFLSTIGPR
ncbi:MAG: F0F1 ATP synthase subunit B [Gemmatimonadetes bacterium]|nr:F0F1 ATP synthase subunit B [Gemmatimonadota bacterium]